MPKKEKKAASTQQYLPIEEIKEDTVLLKDGSIRAVIMVSSVNFALKNEKEKEAIIFSYQSFLNSLNYPIQIMVRSRKLYLDKYINTLEETAKKQTNELLKLQTTQYTEFIQELLNYANIMEKRFFVVVPYYPAGTQQVGTLKRFFSPQADVPSTFKGLKSELSERVDHIISGLSSVGIRCAALNTEELMELYYTAYNPDTSGEEKLTNPEMIESPVIHMSGGPNAR